MDIHEWIEKSKSIILEKSQKPLSFDSLEEEFAELHLELTYACNMKCRMCDIWGKYKREPSLPRREMSVEELVDYIEESRLLKGIGGVIISGGEPFLKRDIVELIGYFLTKYPFASIGILSNLYSPHLTSSRLKEVGKRFGINRLWIGTSLDGIDASHDNTRGVADAFKNFNETLYIIKQDFPKLPIAVNFTLTTENYRDLFSAYLFCKSCSVTMSVQFPVPWKDAEVFLFNQKELDAIEFQIVNIIQEEINDFSLGKILEDELIAKIFYLIGLVDYQKNPRRVFKKCVAGRRFFTASPDGKIYFCPVLKHMIVGDLREMSLDEIWKDKDAKKLRKKIDSGFCHCWLNCTIYPNIGEMLNKKKQNKEEKTSVLNV